MSFIKFLICFFLWKNPIFFFPNKNILTFIALHWRGNNRFIEFFFFFLPYFRFTNHNSISHKSTHFTFLYYKKIKSFIKTPSVGMWNKGAISFFFSGGKWKYLKKIKIKLKNKKPILKLNFFFYLIACLGFKYLFCYSLRCELKSLREVGECLQLQRLILLFGKRHRV